MILGGLAAIRPRTRQVSPSKTLSKKVGKFAVPIVYCFMFYAKSPVKTLIGVVNNN